MTKWLQILHKYQSEGFAEIPGKQHNPIILGWMQGPGGAPWTKTDDSGDPWCGGCAAGVLTEAGLGECLPSLPVRASTWLELPEELNEPRVGCIAVFKRKSGHHVTFVDRIDGKWLWCIGGNQSNKICTQRFSAKSALGYRWPVKLYGGKDITKVSRIAAAARRQKVDAGKAGTATATIPVVPDPIAPSTAGVKEAVETMVTDLSWIEGIKDHIASFLVHCQGEWFLVALVVAAYFGTRMMWDSHLISTFRRQDHEEGRTT